VFGKPHRLPLIAGAGDPKDGNMAKAAIDKLDATDADGGDDL
jgi:hypothetical protein